jgi:hypothetical protein
LAYEELKSLDFWEFPSKTSNVLVILMVLRLIMRCYRAK